MPLTLFPTLDGLHVSCFSCPGRRVTHTFTFYVPDIGKSPTRPVPKWLFFPVWPKKILSILVRNFSSQLALWQQFWYSECPATCFLSRGKRKTEAFQFHCHLLFVTVVGVFFLSAFVVSHVLWEKQTTSKSDSRGWALSNVLSIFLEYLNKVELGNCQ